MRLLARIVGGYVVKGTAAELVGLGRTGTVFSRAPADEPNRTGGGPCFRELVAQRIHVGPHLPRPFLLSVTMH